MPIERFMVPGELEPVSHYCHVVRAGDFIYLSGMVGMKADGTIPPDTVSQFEIALKSIDTCLRHAGGRPDQVVKVLVFMTDSAGRFVTEKGPLLQAILLFTLLSAVSGAALYGELRIRHWRFGAMAAMVAMLGVTVWTYWPRG